MGRMDDTKLIKKKREKRSLTDLKSLGQQLLTSGAHVNNLPELLTFISPDSPPPYALESLLSLQSFFTPLVGKLSSSKYSNPDSSTSADSKLTYLTWLRSNFDDFIRCLIDLVVSSQSEDTLREVGLDAIMEFVKVGNAGKFNSSIYDKLIGAIMGSEMGVFDSLLDLLAEKYLNYVDVRYFTYIFLAQIMRTQDRNASVDVENNLQSTLRPIPRGCKELFIENVQAHGAVLYLPTTVLLDVELSVHKIYRLLSCIPPLEASEEKLMMWNDTGTFTEKSKSQKFNDNGLSSKNASKKMKLKFSIAWISFLKLPLPLDVYKEVLATLHQSVIPYLSNPIMLCDFLTRSYDIGGVVSVMALSSLYILMTQHGLEYPNFYNKLYALLEPSVFIAKHRAKFFQLLDSCLKSSLLPAYLVSAFCKKLSRLALFAPPSGALVIVALVHNLLQRHPSINCLVHREGGPDSTSETSEEVKGSSETAVECSANRDLFEEKPGVDHFKNEESDPKDANAMRSSLWEIDTLRHHYSPPVSRFVMSLENDLAVRARLAEIAVKDFCSGSYATIFNDEIRRRVKQVPLAFYKTTPSSLFSEPDFLGWTFKSKDEGSAMANNTTRTSDDHQDQSAKRARMV